MRNFAAAIPDRARRRVKPYKRFFCAPSVPHTVTAQSARRVCLVLLGAAGTKSDKLFYQQAQSMGEAIFDLREIMSVVCFSF